MNRSVVSAAGLVALAGIFVAVNILASATLRSAQVDFTQAKLYTLSEGSKNIARSIDEPLTLDFYYSAKLAAGRPGVQAYAQRVQELLEEYVRVAHGKIKLRVLDPEPFSELEDQAVQFGVQGTPVGDGGERLYFGLVGSNAVANRVVMPFFDPEKDQFLEYQISRILYTLAHPKHRVLGLITGLEIGGVIPDKDSSDPQVPAWQIAREISTLFDVHRINPKDGRLPSDLDVLMVVQPKKLPAPIRYAIDQYVLAGGRAMIFVDPHSESDTPPDPTDQMAVLSYKTFSELPDLFHAWGVKMDREKVATDLLNAKRSLYRTGPGRREPMQYIIWIGLGPKNLNRADAVTGQLSSLIFASAGILEPTDDATTTFTRLAWTSPQSMPIDSLKARFLQDPKRLISDFVPDDKELTMAARITGDAVTAFPDGPPEGAPPSPAEPLTKSVKPINLILVADTDLLADRFWISKTALGGLTKIADNGDFVINGLDNLSGSSDLIGLRARARFARPFDRVEEIRAKAETTYRAQELKLEKEISDTQQRIDQIRNSRPESASVVDPQVREEVDQLEQKLLDARKELRDVRLNLRKDVEALGFRLKMINTALAPTIIALAAVGLGLYRASRRRHDRRAMAHQ